MDLIALSLDFGSPLLLVGLLAAAIPVLLHLLAKVRAPQVYFPTLRFLRASMEKTARRRRVQHWLLMLLRMLALAALAMAVAQPFIKAVDEHLGSDRDTAVVVVLDNSVSMQTVVAGRPQLESARESAIALLEKRNFQKAALVVTNGADARTPPTSLTDRHDLLKRVRAVKGGAGRADLASAVALAEQLLADSNQPNREIYVFSDLQAVSTRGIETLTGGDADTPASLLVVTPPRPDDGGAGVVNLAVTDLEIEQPDLMAGQRIALDVTVRNFSTLAQKARVRLFLDGQELEQSMQVVDLASSHDADAARHVNLTFTVSEQGNHFGHVLVQRMTQAGVPGGDDLPLDDARHFSLGVADRIDVLLVKQRHELDASADAGHLLRQLLNIKLPGMNDQPVRLTEITADQFAPSLLGDVEVAITSDVAGFTAADAEAYRAFARRGGTWMIWLGPTADINAYNQALGPDGVNVLGGRIDRLTGSGAGGADIGGEPVFIQWVDEQHPMFRKLYPDLSAYRKALVYRHAVMSRRSDEAGRVIARLSTNDPLVIETPIERGRVLLFTTAATSRWTNWLNQGQAFAIYQMVMASATRGRGLASNRYEENAAVRIELPAALVPAEGSVGGPPAAKVSIELPNTAVVKEAVTGPASEAAGGQAIATFTATDQVGLYKWQLEGGSGSQRGSFVVNVPADESDLQPLSGDALAGLMPGRTVLVGGSVDELAARIEDYRRGSPIWPYLFALALVLLAVEAKIANRSRPAEGPGLRPAFDRESSPQVEEVPAA